MFSQPVVFVIGAGASAEYGMPVGADLKTKIATAVGFKDAAGRPTGDGDLYRLLASHGDAADIENAGLQLAEAMPSFISIDEALNWFNSSPRIVELGKIAIVREILIAEKISPLFHWAANSPEPETIYGDAWSSHFLSMAMGALTKEESELAFKNVTIVNFNYDRTLEHYLYLALQRKFGLTAGDAARVLSGLKVIRPYGRISALPWQDGAAGVDFGTVSGINDYERLISLAGNIRTYTERELAASVREVIQPYIDRARMVVFLGFGFHEQNMSLLRAKSHEAWRRVFATVQRMDENNHPTMRVAIARVVGSQQEPVLLDWYAYRLLSHLRPALMAAANM